MSGGLPGHDTLVWQESQRVVRTITSDYTVTANDDYVLVDSTSGDVTVTLPPASIGRLIHVLWSNGSNDVIVAPAGSDTVNGAANLTLTTLGVFYTFKGNENDNLCCAGMPPGFDSSSMARKDEANTFTASQTIQGNLILSGVGRRIIGDFSAAAAANRVTFQTNLANGPTTVNIAPNGTGAYAQIMMLNSSDMVNGNSLNISCQGALAAINLTKFGTGVDIPLLFLVGGAERLRIHTYGAIEFNNNHLKRIKVATFSSEVSASGTSGTVTCDFLNGQNRKVVPTGAITSFALSFPGVGHYQLRIAQGGTAYAITWTFSGVTAYQIDGGAPTVAANKSTFLNIFYDGTNAYYSRSQQV